MPMIKYLRMINLKQDVNCFFLKDYFVIAMVFETLLDAQDFQMISEILA